MSTSRTTHAVNGSRHATQPYIRQYGGTDINRSLDFTLAAVPDVDLDGYLRALALRARHVRDWTLFMERYPLVVGRSEEHTSELQSQSNLVCRLLLEKKKILIITLYSGSHVCL